MSRDDEASKLSTPPSAESGSHIRPSQVGWIMVLAVGLTAGLASFAVGEAAPKIFRPSTQVSDEARRTNRVAAEFEGHRRDAMGKAATLTYGALGLLLGLGLGLAGGLARHSFTAGVIAAVLGSVLGAAGGASMTLALLPSYHATRATFSEDDISSDLVLALKTHGGIWLTIGAAAGLALAIGMGERRAFQGVVGGLLGAAAGTLLYEFIAAVAFPNGQSFRPVAEEFSPRLLAHLAVSIAVSAGALWSITNLSVRRPTG